MALALSSNADRLSQAEATPWDSGAFYDQLCPHLPSPPDGLRRRIFHEQSLPAPEYRTYLVHYVASCFANARSYLKLEPCRFADPVSALSSNRFSRVFEVRFAGKLPLPGVLLATFLPHNAGKGGGYARRAAMLRLQGPAGIHVLSYRGSEEELKDAVCRWILNQVGLASQESR